jgi:hypothetical protein
MNKIYIFYALIEEGKNKQLNLNGPFIHYRPAKGEQLEEEDYLFDKESYIEEKKYLSRLLRQKSPAKISIFHYYDATGVEKITIKCDSCGQTHTVGTDRCGSTLICSTCESKRQRKIKMNEEKEARKSGRLEEVGSPKQLVIPSLKDVSEKTRQRAMFEAEDYFENKFQQMSNNYAICNRKR